MDDFTLFKIGTDMLMKKDVSQWPKVDVVMFKRSSNMPMSKIEAFCKIHRPLLINDIATQHTILSDRRLVYKTLQRAGVRGVRPLNISSISVLLTHITAHSIFVVVSLPLISLKTKLEHRYLYPNM